MPTLVKHKKKLEVAEDDLEVQILDDSQDNRKGKDGKFIKNTWIEDHSSSKGILPAFNKLTGDQLEDLQSKSSEPASLKASANNHKSKFKVNCDPERSRINKTEVENLTGRDQMQETQEVRLDFDKDYEDSPSGKRNVVSNNFVERRSSHKRKRRTKPKRTDEDQIVTMEQKPDGSPGHFVSQQSLKVEEYDMGEDKNPYGNPGMSLMPLNFSTDISDPQIPPCHEMVNISPIKVKKKKKRIKKIVKNFGKLIPLSPQMETEKAASTVLETVQDEDQGIAPSTDPRRK